MNLLISSEHKSSSGRKEKAIINSDKEKSRKWFKNNQHNKLMIKRRNFKENFNTWIKIWNDPPNEYQVISNIKHESNELLFVIRRLCEITE